MKENLRTLFSLSGDQADNEEIRNRIAEGASLKGSAIYILIFAILIASVGLNMNSTAVVIGAMLISPLMGVIMSFAFAIAGQDFNMAKSAVIKTLVQVSVSIVTSTIYFILSPMNSFSGELMARTLPTFWDVLIAFFGGFSAIIAFTRKNPVSNVIPGAAIATALMPPLCTTGYCIAHLKWIPAAGSLYLFMINVIFICFSAITGLYLMKVVNVRKLLTNRKAKMILALTVILAIIPSGVLAWKLVREENAEKNYKLFMEKELAFDHARIVSASISHENKTIDVFLMGNKVEEKDRTAAEKGLEEYDLEDYTLNIVQAASQEGFSREELEQFMEDRDSPTGPEKKEEEKLVALITAKGEMEKNTAREVIILYPEVVKAGFAEVTDSEGTTEHVLVLEVKKLLKEEEKKALDQWLEIKMEKKVRLIQLPVKERKN